MEFALVLPILLAVALAFVQVGLIVKDQLVLIGASRAGAREAVVDPDDLAVRSAVEGAAAGLDLARLRVDIQRAGERGDPVTVVVSYDARVSVPVVDWLFPPAIVLSSSATMRQEFA